MRLLYREGLIMELLKILDALVEEHGTVVAFVVPCFALLASFLLVALASS